MLWVSERQTCCQYERAVFTAGKHMFAWVGKCTSFSLLVDVTKLTRVCVLTLVYGHTQLQLMFMWFVYVDMGTVIAVLKKERSVLCMVMKLT